MVHFYEIINLLAHNCMCNINILNLLSEIHLDGSDRDVFVGVCRSVETKIAGIEYITREKCTATSS